MAKLSRTCRGCGCTDDPACPGGCSWVLMDFGYRDGYALESAGNAHAVAPRTQVVPWPTGLCSTCADECSWDFHHMATFVCVTAQRIYARALKGVADG